MNSKERKNSQPSAEDARRTVKKPYVKPEVRHERVFETMALSCGKVRVTEFSCHSSRKAS